VTGWKSRDSDELVIIPKRGTPASVTSRKQELFGFVDGEFKVVGDIESPLVSLEEWEVMRK